MKMEQTVWSETLAYTIQTPGITQKKAYNMINVGCQYSRYDNTTNYYKDRGVAKFEISQRSF